MLFPACLRAPGRPVSGRPRRRDDQLADLGATRERDLVASRQANRRATLNRCGRRLGGTTDRTSKDVGRLGIETGSDSTAHGRRRTSASRSLNRLRGMVRASWVRSISRRARACYCRFVSRGRIRCPDVGVVAKVFDVGGGRRYRQLRPIGYPDFMKPIETDARPKWTCNRGLTALETQ
jgi:hypothetical protein